MGSNVSLEGFLARLLPAATWLRYVVTAALVLATALLTWPRDRRYPTGLREFALVTTVVCLIVPNLWYHQQVLLLIPAFAVVEHALSTAGRRWMLAPALIGYLLADIHGLVWHALEPYPLLASTPFYYALLLWALLAWLSLSPKRATVVAQAA